jgi:polysaccharide biosynthesis transport protein
MYRPREPESRAPAPTPSASAPSRTSRFGSSLLDHIGEPARTNAAAPTADTRRADEWHEPTTTAEEARYQPNSRPDAETAQAQYRDPQPVHYPPARSANAPMQAQIDAMKGSLSEIGVGHLLLWLRRGAASIIALTVLGIIAAFLYAATATPRYTVYTDLIIDPQNLNVVSDDVFAASTQRDSQLLEVESKLRVLTSRNVLQQVIRELNLTEDPEFNRPSMLSGLLGSRSSAAPEARELEVMRELSERVTAGREERSFVVTLAVWTSDPQKSVTLSEAVVRAFESELFVSSADSAGRLAADINSRLDELRASVTAAEEKVEQFKRENNIQESNTGELASSRISSALDTQVLDAQQRLIQAEAAYNQMRSALDGRQAATAPIFDSTSMQTLRASYNTLQQQIGAMSRTYGARHPRLVALQSEQTAIESAIASEANRILQLARTDMDQARATLSQLRSRADAERSTVFSNNDAQVQLRELERDARAKAAVYETYLSRTHQINERQQIDATNMRVISQPVPPRSKSWPPRNAVLLPAGAFAGFAIGCALALALGLAGYLRDARRHSAGGYRYA